MAMDKTIYFLLVCNVISNSAYGMIAPFLPQKLQSKDVEENMIGIIFSVYSASVIIMSLFVGKVFDKFGPVTTIAYGLFQMGCAIILFGFIEIMDSSTMITFYAICVRLLQGASSAIIQTTCYIIITKFYPSMQTMLVGYIEATTGLGIILGPLIGSCLYAKLDFQWTFYSYGMCFLIFSAAACFLVETTPQEETGDDFQRSRTTSAEFSLTRSFSYVEQNEDSPKIGYCEMLKIRLFTLAAGSAMASQIQYGFMEPILAPRLLDFNLSQTQIGLFFVILPVFYVISCLVVSHLPKSLNKHAVMMTGMWLMGAGCFFVGPSQVFNFSDTLMVMAIGQAFCGIFYPICLIPSLPAMIEEVQKHYPGQDDNVKNLVSGMFNSIIGIGMFTGPLLGAFFTKEYGFRLCGDIMGFIFIAYGILYFIFGNGVKQFRRSSWSKKKSSKQYAKEDYQPLDDSKDKDNEFYLHNDAIEKLAPENSDQKTGDAEKGIN